MTRPTTGHNHFHSYGIEAVTNSTRTPKFRFLVDFGTLSKISKQTVTYMALGVGRGVRDRVNNYHMKKGGG
jgi:hypothetical protein